MDKYEQIKGLLDELYRENDLYYDCLFMVLANEYGELEAQRLHKEASNRFKDLIDYHERTKNYHKGL